MWDRARVISLASLQPSNVSPLPVYYPCPSNSICINGVNGNFTCDCITPPCTGTIVITPSPSPSPMCNSGDQQACTLPDGSGMESCFSGMWGPCIATQCNTGFTVSNNVCVPYQCTPNAVRTCTFPNGTGLEVCTSSFSWALCLAYTCDAG
jgi:hypothetical protein